VPVYKRDGDGYSLVGVSKVIIGEQKMLKYNTTDPRRIVEKELEHQARLRRTNKEKNDKKLKRAKKDEDDDHDDD